MFHFPMFHFPLVCLAPDTGSGGGVDEKPAPGTEPAETPPGEEPVQEPPVDAQPPAAQEPDAERAPQEEAKTEPIPDAADRLKAAQQRIMTAELRSAAALAGVPKERIAYVLRLADTTGIDLDANDAGEKIEAAIGKVLADLPELRGSAGGTGSTGNFARKTGEGEDPDMARIRKNILG